MDYAAESNVEYRDRKRIKNSKDVYDVARELIPDDQKESFIGIYLNTKNEIIKSELISIGSLNFAPIHPREVFKPAILNSANSVIVVHNHPSGDVDPSRDDEEITRRLMDAGKILGIEVLDHVIIGDGYLSFKEHADKYLKKEG